MRKYFLIVRANIRKAKGQSVTISVLILIAALMLNLWLMLSMDYKANFTRYHDKLNAEHVTLSVDGDMDEVQSTLAQAIENDSRTLEFCLDDCMHASGTFSYNGGEMNAWFVFLEKQAALTRSIGKIEIVEDGTFTSGVYLPMIYKTGDIAIGNPIEISIGSEKVTYRVCGFFNSVMMGSHNCALTELVFTKDQYLEMEKRGYAAHATLCSVRLNDKSENLNYEATLKSKISEKYPNITMVSNCFDIVTQSRYIS